MSIRPVLLFGSIAVLAACSPEPDSSANGFEPANEVVLENEVDSNILGGTGNEMGAAESFQLLDGAGKAVGTVAVERDVRGATLQVAVAGLGAGTHGIHLHEAGLCEGPGFTSAGAHWNPAGRQHGKDNPQGAHLGDLPNLDVSSGGEGSASFLVEGGSIADADGTSLVIHAKADDYKTDPSGNSGDRIACAVLAPPR